MTDSASALRATLGDRYDIGRRIGEGGMATVYLARDLKHDRAVALKVLHPELARSLGAERFEREVRVAARLQHPHILTVLDSGETDGLLWFTMPYVEGESLRDRLRRDGQLPVADAVRIVREAALALDYAHRQGIVHRDIKPENILLADGQALVADFGIARATGGGESITATGMVVGTPTYMSPEQAAGETVDPRTDVYALGCVLYEMLAGEPPFTGPTAQSVIAKRMSTEAPAVDVTRSGLPPALAGVTARSLRRAPADRFATAADFAQALEQAVQGAGDTATAQRADPPLPPPPRPPSGGQGRLVLFVLGLLLGVGALFAWRRAAISDVSATAAAAADSRERRIAVLPFENLGDSADAYFADGITDAVRGKLTGLADLEVIARASSMQYADSPKSPSEIARELGVRYLLTGTVRWAKGSGGVSRVQVSPELVEVGGDGAAASRWQQPFDAELADVFKVQGEIANQVAQALTLALPGPERARLAEAPTTIPAAYDAFLRGEAITSVGWTVPGEIRRAIAEYERAVRLDTTFAEAWARLSMVNSRLYYSRVDPALARQGRIAADRALRIAPTSALGHLALGFYYRFVASDPPSALAEFEKARVAAPNDVTVLTGLAGVLRSLGRFEEAARELRRAQRLDPLFPDPVQNLATLLLWLRDYPQARIATDRLLALAPNSLAAIQARVMLELAEGRLPEARRIVQNPPPGVDRDELAVYLSIYWDVGWVLDDATQERVLALEPAIFDGDRATQALVRAQLYGWRGDSARARQWGDTAARAFLAQLQDTPDDAQLHGLRGLALAYAGRGKEAIASGERGVTLLPVTLDAHSGSYQAHLMARILLLAGERERALDELEQLLARPYFLSPGWLRIDPTWAPLRGHPRFERLTAAR